MTQDYVFRGDNSMTPIENMVIECLEKHNRSDLADCIRNGRLYRRLDRIGYYDPAYKKSGFRQVFGQDIPSDFNPPEEDVIWRLYMMNRYKDNKGLQEVMKKFGWSIERAEKEAQEWYIAHKKN